MYEYLTAATICLIVTWMWSKSRPSGMPPGPVVFPVVNNIPSLSFDHKLVSSIQKHHNQYGPIISFSVVGHGLWDVWVDGYDLIKELLHDPRFTNRSVFGPMIEMNFHRGARMGNFGGFESETKDNVASHESNGCRQNRFRHRS